MRDPKFRAWFKKELTARGRFTPYPDFTEMDASGALKELLAIEHTREIDEKPTIGYYFDEIVGNYELDQRAPTVGYEELAERAMRGEMKG